jgi:hypothetical protein
LQDDTIRLVDNARVAGNEVLLDIFRDIHEFQLNVGKMPEADDIIARISNWLRGWLMIVIGASII